MKHLTGNTPLADYLRKKKLTLCEFSKILTRDRGSNAGITLVSRWSNGERIPGNTSIAAISRATNGEVTAKKWKNWLDKQSRKSSVSASPVIREALGLAAAVGDLESIVEKASADGIITDDEAEEIEQKSHHVDEHNSY